MEVLKRILPVLFFPLLLTGCDYIGFDGYLNQLEDLGITHDLADAVTFNQHLTSRPREFRGKVYVLGTRGVFVMDADKLTSYQFYAYENADVLDYHSDYREDELPPINCYLRPEDGRVVISSLNQDRGLRYGDTLTLYEDPRRAVYQPVSTGWGTPPSLLLNSAGITNYVINDLYNSGVDYIELIDDPVTYTIVETSIPFPPAVDEFVLNQSLRGDAAGDSFAVVTQLGKVFPQKGSATLNVYRFQTGAWGFGASVGSVFIPDPVNHDQYKYTSSNFYISGRLNVSTNDRYLLAWGEGFEDREVMLIYDYISGLEVHRGEIPAENLNAELAESGLSVYTSSVLGGVARYEYD